MQLLMPDSENGAPGFRGRPEVGNEMLDHGATGCARRAAHWEVGVYGNVDGFPVHK